MTMASNLLAQASYWLKLTNHNLYFGSSFAFSSHPSPCLRRVAFASGRWRQHVRHLRRAHGGPNPRRRTIGAASVGAFTKRHRHRRRRLGNACLRASVEIGVKDNCLRNKSWTTCAEQKNKGPQGCRAWPRRTTRKIYIGLYQRPSANRKGRQISCGWTCRRQRA